MKMNQEQTELETRLSTAINLITHLYNIPITALPDRKSTEEVCKRYRHHPIQYYFNEKVLDMVRQNLEEDAAYHISDAFLVHFILFSIDSVPYMFGPFCTVLLSEKDVQKLFAELSLQNLDRDQFHVYFSRFACISESEAERIAAELISSVNPSEKDKVIRRIKHQSNAFQAEAEKSFQGKHHQLLVERRYGIEKQFMEAIRLGESREAVKLLHSLRQEVSYLYAAGSTLESYRLGAATTRTMVRIAALQAGLPAYVIDRIAFASTTAIRNEKSPDAILLMEDKMVRDFCRAIREMRTEQYSALVQNVIYRLHHDLTDDLKISVIAEEMNISEGYLVSCFKKEIGVTPSVYLAKARMQRAAMLLTSGSMSVSGVSNAVGIMDANYFVKLFKKEFGETPSAFRKRHTS